jgi:UDP-GlcNAc3NAcA epimerase
MCRVSGHQDPHRASTSLLERRPRCRVPMNRRRIALCYGTRPQVIKASRLNAALERAYDVITVDTGQHYDYELNALLYEQLGIRTPDALLDVGSSDHATQTSAILGRAAALFQERSPTAVVVIGDTNSTLGCALAAAQLMIPVVHVEAGLRSGDLAMVEELNRRVVDSFAAVLCAPSDRAAEQLRTESVPGAVVTTGDVARDVLRSQLERIETLSVEELPPGGEAFVFATLHRAELTGDPDCLADVLRALGDITMPVVLPMHPRTRAIVDRFGLGKAIPSNVYVRKPFGYLETLVSIRDAAAVMTDSGGVQREAYWMGTPCVTMRNETEWTETIDRGANRLVLPGDASASLGAGISDALASARDWDRDAYGKGFAADAIAASIELARRAPLRMERPVFA